MFPFLVYHFLFLHFLLAIYIFSPVSSPKVDVHESLFSFNFNFCTAQIPLLLIMSLNVSVMYVVSCHDFKIKFLIH